MKTKNVISGSFRAVIYLAFVMALLFFPPMALHGQAGVGDGHQVVIADTSDAAHDHGEPDALNVHCSASVSTADVEVGANQCCDSICLSFTLEETLTAFSDQTLPVHEIVLHAQMVAYDPGGFLRPPKT
ncbi:hypothetical protein [Sulfitobacter sp. MF3-043]|uniref:hypothetical protein n=1 Tax=Sulfitobacter sediminivivens TaxID=3252902 RepID=UPI0036DDF95D